MKKVLLAIALSIAYTTCAVAQTASHTVVGSQLTAPQTNCTVGPCWVPNSPTNPIYTTPGSSSTAQLVTPASRTLVTLDVKTVTTGGTAVTALTAGHRTAGGFIQNPPSATINLCINEIGTATGTTSSGDTTCITPGSSYRLSPATTAVSVISSDSAHPFSGYGLN